MVQLGIVAKGGREEKRRVAERWIELKSGCGEKAPALKTCGLYKTKRTDTLRFC